MSARHKLHQRHLRRGPGDVLAATAQDGAQGCAVQYATLPWRRGADGSIKVHDYTADNACPTNSGT